MRLEVCVDTILAAPPWDDIVFSAIDEDGCHRRCVTVCRALFRRPRPGESWLIEGKQAVHPSYGEQFLVEKGVLRAPSTKLIARYLSTHPAFRGTGVGAVAAHRLVERFGSELLRLLNDRTDTTVAEFLGPERAFALRDAWQGLFAEQTLLNWMLERGLDLRWAEKLRQVYGERARDEVERNPYILIALSNWSEVDRLAEESFGVQAGDPRRLVAAAECSFYEFLDATGSTVSDRETLIERTAPKVLGERARAIEAIDEALARRVLIERSGGLQSVGPALMEEAVGACLARLRQTPASWPLLVPPEAFTATLTRVEEQRGIRLNAEQRRVVQLGLIEPLAIVRGGAGVGKTTALRALAECLHIARRRACFVAVAGRAARRIAEAIGSEMEKEFPCRTIASFLAAQDNEALGYDFLLVVDEASMADLATFYRLSRRLPRASRLLLVGDPAQLPPIGAGLVFHCLVEESYGPQIELTHVFRQTEATCIPSVARAVREGNIPALATRLPPEGVCFVESAHPLRDCLRLRDEMLAGGEIMVLTVHRKTADAINNALHPGLGFEPGDPVMFTTNDRELGLSNGSLGRVSDILLDAVQVNWDDGREHSIMGWRLLYLRLAYAVTVHKLQGSQAEQVIVLVEPSRLLDRNLLYTAITRARRRAVIIGRQSQFEAAVAGKPLALLRRVGLNLNLHAATSSHL